MKNQCSHLDQIKFETTDKHVCEECVKMGDKWVHLRLCLTCGHVGCCDSSPLRHARAHAYADGHPIVASLEPGEDWRWCYADQAYV